MLLGSKLQGQLAQNFLGWSVALSGNGKTLAASAPSIDEEGSSSNSLVRVWQYSQDINQWQPVGNAIPAPDKAVQVALSADGNVLAIAGNGQSGPEVHVGSVLLCRLMAKPSQRGHQTT